MRTPNKTRLGKLAILGVCALLAALMILPASAQETTGTISGTVTDPSGAVVPGVEVTITNQETNRAITTQTNSAGIYIARDLAPGRYAITMESPGFAKHEIPGVILLVGRTAQINAKLEVGQVSDVVVVSEQAPLIDTASTMIANNVTSEELDGLPKGRSFQAIALFSPSVNTGEIEGGYQVNGASAAENNYYIDGVSTTSLIDGSARQNTKFEYIQEVQVKTAGLDAQYGGALGGVVSAVTKSGGNEFHGEFHYYHYGNRLSAGPVKRLELDPADSTRQNVGYIQDDKDTSDNNELGGSIGGPFIKNRLYFFASVSPLWNHRKRDLLFDNGDTPGTMERDWDVMSSFAKLSFDPTNRVRMHFSWLYTPQYMEGSIFGYNGFAPNVSTASPATAQAAANNGFNQPEQSYGGTVDFTLTNTSLLSVKGGRYYLNYKDVGVEDSRYYWFITPNIGLEGVPEALQHASGFTSPTAAATLYDITTRTYVQADYSLFLNMGGQHNIKAGVGTQKNVNKVNDAWYGPQGRIRIYWDSDYRQAGDGGQYGWYLVEDGATQGSTGAHITHLYVQDQWRIHPRVTLNLGLRSEKETIPSFRRDIQEKAFDFGFGDKLAPRLGASVDVLGNGKLKLFGGWGRYYDWTKYDLARGTFGGDKWDIYYRTLDSLDPFVDPADPGTWTIGLDNLPGTDLWNLYFGSPVRNLRQPGFDLLDPNVKPMSSDITNVGIEYEIQPQMVFAARYVRNKLNRTIEDFGALDENGDEVYRYGNPGEGIYEIAPVSGATCTVEIDGVCGFRMPKAKRIYDAMELQLTRRLSKGWFASASYVYSKLYGNYAGLQSTDEIRPPTLPYSSPGNQAFFGQIYRSGGNANRYFDLDEAMWDANGNVGPFGVLPTDRPHVFKFTGSKQFSWGTEVGGFFRASSGTPNSTLVTTVNGIPVLVNGRGDMGRTPVFTQTDLVVAHEFKVAEKKHLRLEFNMINLFNQKTNMFNYDRLNFEEFDGAHIDLSETDLSQGFDYQKMIAESPDGVEGRAFDTRYGKGALFNPGFSGRFLIKFIF